MMNHFMIFFVTALSGTIMSMSANSWWVGWLGMEMNLLGFIILMMSNKDNESALKYFVIQSLGSVVLMSSSFLSENFSINSIQMLMNLSLLLKLGAAPLHFWLPVIMENLNKYQLTFLLTWQKLAPLYLLFSLSLIHMNMLFMLTSLMLGAAGSMNELRIFMLLTYSSMNHTGWMILTLISNEIMSFIYMFVYSLLMTSVLFPMYSKTMQSFWLFKGFYKWLMLLNLLSLGGLPPFTGFVMKWILLSEMYFMISNALNIMLILTSVMLIYFYLRLTMNSFLSNSLEVMSMNKNKNSNFTIFSLINLFCLYIFLF